MPGALRGLRGFGGESSVRAKEVGIDLVGPRGTLANVTKNVMEGGHGTEPTERLGYQAHEPPAAFG
jgi:hypothetical protein